MSGREASKSLIGINSFFEGKFYITGELQVDGKFEGLSLRVGHLFVSKTGKVKSNIKASTIVVEGIIIGDLTATDRIILYPSARVLGNLKTPELIIQKGVIVEGKCTISNDLEHPAKDVIESLYGEK